MHDIELGAAIIITVFTRLKFGSNHGALRSLFITVAALHPTVNFLSEVRCVCGRVAFIFDTLLSSGNIPAFPAWER